MSAGEPEQITLYSQLALFTFLDSDEGLFKGPYVDIRLPFRKAGAGERIPLEVRPALDRYKHQMKAFDRLYSKDGHQPQHTRVSRLRQPQKVSLSEPGRM